MVRKLGERGRRDYLFCSILRLSICNEVAHQGVYCKRLYLAEISRVVGIVQGVLKLSQSVGVYGNCYTLGLHRYPKKSMIPQHVKGVHTLYIGRLVEFQ